MSQSEARSGGSSGRGDNRAESGLTVLAFFHIIRKSLIGVGVRRAEQFREVGLLRICRHGVPGRVASPVGR